jgi:hypothetical protein
MELRIARDVAARDTRDVEPEPMLDRDVAQRVALAVFDILEEVTAIRLLLEDDDGQEVQEDLE